MSLTTYALAYKVEGGSCTGVFVGIFRFEVALLLAASVSTASAQTQQADFASIPLPTLTAPVIVRYDDRGGGFRERVFLRAAGWRAAAAAGAPAA